MEKKLNGAYHFEEEEQQDFEIFHRKCRRMVEWVTGKPYSIWVKKVLVNMRGLIETELGTMIESEIFHPKTEE